MHICTIVLIFYTCWFSFIHFQPADSKDDFFASFSESPPPAASQPQPQQQPAESKDIDLLGGAMDAPQSSSSAVS